MTTKARYRTIAVACVAAVMAAACASVGGDRADSSAGTERSDAIERNDVKVASAPGIEVGVREVMPPEADGVPVILLHGARVPGIASFDLPVDGYSLAADLAEEGHPTFIMDARGYGASTRPQEMETEPIAGSPVVRSNEVVQDIGAVVDHVQTTTGADQVALLGWATGGHWAGMYAAANPGDIGKLVIYNSLYGATDQHPTLGYGSDYEDRGIPGAFDRQAGAYRLSDGPSLLTSWDRYIPSDDPTVWRDPRVADAYQQQALASDPTSGRRNPASFRAPNGAMEDSFYLATGRQLWDASLIEASTLILRSQHDFWSRPDDVTQLQRHLARAADVRAVELTEATHYAHLDRSDRGRTQFLDEVVGFLR